MPLRTPALPAPSIHTGSACAICGFPSRPFALPFFVLTSRLTLRYGSSVYTPSHSPSTYMPYACSNTTIRHTLAYAHILPRHTFLPRCFCIWTPAVCRTAAAPAYLPDTFGRAAGCAAATLRGVYTWVRFAYTALVARALGPGRWTRHAALRPLPSTCGLHYPLFISVGTTTRLASPLHRLRYALPAYTPHLSATYATTTRHCAWFLRTFCC